MVNLANTYQLIADILDLNTTHTNALNIKLETNKVDWDSVVVEGSKHLVLPALYCKLKSKHLLHHLPQELQYYLKEITEINRTRNNAILRQAKSISKLFKTHNIDHVFLKGTALCATNYFEDIAERMIGDIDILVEKEKLQEAYVLLENNSYNGVKTTLGTDFFEHKHLPRLISNKHIGAVELHLKLFMTYKLEELNPKNILKNKTLDFDLNVPSNTHLLLHNILNYQINDRGSLYHNISFRAAYDTIILLQKVNVARLKKIYNKKPFKSYFKNLSLFFKSLRTQLGVQPSLISHFFLLRLKYKKLNRIYYMLLTRIAFMIEVINRLYFFVFNTNYRTAVLNDKTRIVNVFKKRMAFKK